MIEELQARFMPQFLAQARVRIERVRGILARREDAAMVSALRDLHTLVGEAGLLGLDKLIPLARRTETAMHRMVETRDDGDAVAVEQALDALGKGLELVTPSPAGEKSP